MMRIELDNSNPLEDFFEDYEWILNNTTIKYSVLAEENETFFSKANADQYKAAIQESDTYYSYYDYTREDLINAGLDGVSASLYAQIEDGDYLDIPTQYQDALLKARRQRTIDQFEEQNDYYRMLNGYPPYGTKVSEYHYLGVSTADRFGIDRSIPIHEIQDYYNQLADSTGESYKTGDYYIKNIAALGIIDQLIELYPDETYLKYIGSNRLDIVQARDAGNFEIMLAKQGKMKTVEYEEFIRIYEQCRIYFLTCIYQPEHRKVIEYYDNFIAMCIMLFALSQLTTRAMPMAVSRKFFRNQGIRMLYEAYNVPYDMSIDEIQQQQIVERLNLLVVWKASNQVLYDITELLGFSRITIYKYYLMRSHKFDSFGVPVFATKEGFNSDTGEVEEMPDYEAMYDTYFEKMELRVEDFLEAFTSNSNREEYETITTDDPFWWEDTPLYKERTETPFNYVETKYISLGINYSMTEILYECVLMPKMVMYFKDELETVTLTLPKIDPDLSVTLFDTIIYYICLVCAKHHLRGDIIAIPTQVTDVLQYMQDVTNYDYLVDAFAFDFDLFKDDSEEGQYVLSRVMGILTPECREEFLSYLEVLSIDSNATNEEKMDAFNTMFTNIRNLNQWIEYRLTKTDNRQEYITLKMFYRTAYYAKEMRELFTIGFGSAYVEDMSDPGTTRTAWTYFEYLYYENPALYSTMFTPNYEGGYTTYLEENDLTEEDLSLEEYEYRVFRGEIVHDYSTLYTDNPNLEVTEELLYYYIDHVIYRLSDYIDNIDMLYVRNDTETPLETLLIRLIKFFKSLTVDFIGLDITLICDFKNENILKFFDEVYSMEKTLETHTWLNMSQADIIKAMIAFIWQDDFIHFREALSLIAYVTIDDKENNNIIMTDMVKSAIKHILTGGNDNDNLRLYDTFTKSIDESVSDKSETRLTDGIVGLYYTDSEDDEDDESGGGSS